MTIPEATGRVANPAFSALFAVARLRPGATIEQVAAEGTTIARRRDPKPLAARLTFGDGGAAVVHARPMADEMTARVRSSLLILSAGIGCILLIACVNAANLLLSRGAMHTREFAVRAALGASRGRLTRDLLTQSLLLAGVATAIGLLVAALAIRAASRLAPADFPRLDDIRLDLPTFGIAVGATLFTALAAAVPAIWQLRRVSSAAAVTRGYSQGMAPIRGGRRLRSGLIAAEAAFAVVVLVAALLLARSFVELARVDPGYSPEGVLVADIHRPGSDLASATQFAPLMAEALERIRALPGVEAAAFGVPTPLDVNTSLAAFPSLKSVRTEEQVVAGVGAPVPTALARFYGVTPGFDRALGLRLRVGRFFERADQDSGDVVRWVVNEEFARLYLPPDPVGREFPWARAGKPVRLEIIGLVANVLKNGNDEAPAAEIYGIRRDTDPFFNPALVVRAAPGSDLGPAIRAVLRDVAPEAIVAIAPLTDRVSASLAMPRLASALFACIAILATALTALGILAALSYGLAQRAREFGVRAAVGATRRQIVALVARDGALPATVGVILGLLAAVAVTRGMRSVLFGISPVDVVSFVVAPALLVPVALLACLVPALRSSRIDLVSVLKSD
jgi:predicted permease